MGHTIERLAGEHPAGYLALSFSHKNTEISIREKLAFDSNEATSGSSKDFLQTLKSQNPSIEEVLLLATCNRVEIYIYGCDLETIADVVLDLLAKTKGIDAKYLKEIADIYTDQGAVHHVFCVASSLDSIVVGETQIAGQLKSAYKFCFDNGFCSKNLTRLIHFAFRCAAQVRNSTQISQNAVSVASVAVKQANAIFEQSGLSDKIAIVVGAGEMGVLASKHLLSCGYRILLLNRNKQKALALANELDNGSSDLIEVRNFSELPTLINQYPLLFSATSSPCPIILNSMTELTDFRRFWFDLAVPRDIEKPNIDNIFLFSVDDLEQVVYENLANRQKNTTQAYEIIGYYTLEFFRWLQSLGVEPLIKKLRELAKDASLKELDRAIKKGFLPKEYEENVAKILHSAFNVFLHQPTITIKKFADKEEADPIIEAIKSVFNIDEDGIFINRYKCEYDTTLN
ncbi:glutamyl-tRNA reductase [Helicobacter sp. 11S02596-1]|uniref:glutamyl-tRNA reductase n=1 Tax=Helicobacter sp. 11S02596-1 TaxID=1476194 RepID=UPI000BA62DA0|nr:glutamyl-tRNA reductase [Helicobacter sp. 11S02596-1]PAF41652.1 glutamyl-tRNA reductase [Helicobacter sp. 11S02596-1]